MHLPTPSHDLSLPPAAPPFLSHLSLVSFPLSSLRSNFHTSFMILSTSGGESEISSSLCSCYAPITLHNNKSGDGRESKKASSPVNGHGIGPVGQQLLPPPSLPSPLKSNLKKPIRVEEQQQEEEEEEEVMVRNGRRKVSWPDAHGRDLAHVQVFHSSVLEEGEFAVARKSCICSIQ